MGILKGKKSIFIIIAVVLVIGAFIVIGGRIRHKGVSETMEDSEAVVNTMIEPEGKMLLELTYDSKDEKAPTTSTIRFYDDRTFTCTSLVSSMYHVEYATSYDAQNGLKVETVKNYTSLATEESSVFRKLIGLPDKLNFNIVHNVESNENGNVTLTIKTEIENADPSIIGGVELTSAQLKELADATKGVEAPVIE